MGGNTIYVYDALGQLAAEYNTFATTPACQTCYLSTDHLGSIRLVTDQSGNVVVRHDYLPFGEEIPANTAGRNGEWALSADNVSERFTGQVRDSETGIDYFNARYFGAALGRFTSPDAYVSETCMVDPQQWNRYSYVRNNPPALIDPTGLSATSAAGSSTDCNQLTQKIGLAGFNYAEASRIWNDGNLAGAKNGPTLAALAAVTWQGESDFSLNPINNGNYRNGVLTSVDYGPFQINSTFNPNRNASVWGTNGAGAAFNGDPDANLAFGITILTRLEKRFGDSAAGLYTGRRNPARPGRQSTYDQFKDGLQALFGSPDCFSQVPGPSQPHAPAKGGGGGGSASSTITYGPPGGWGPFGWSGFDVLQFLFPTLPTRTPPVM